MRQYIDNFFDSGTGIQWTKERMRDRILEIFNYWETNKNRNKLHIRKGSEEETRIIECISNIFNFKGLESLNDTKWEIKNGLTKKNSLSGSSNIQPGPMKNKPKIQKYSNSQK